MSEFIAAAFLTILAATPSFAAQTCPAKLVPFTTGQHNAAVYINPCNVAFLKDNLTGGTNRTRINFIATGEQQLDVNEDISAVATAIDAALTISP
jgi:hypothetical protein